MYLRYNSKTGEALNAYNIPVPKPYIEITEEKYNEMVASDNKYFVVNGKLTTEETENYKLSKRLPELEEEYLQATKDYEAAMNTEVTYTNGFTYYPRYAQETYQGLIVAEQVAQTQGLSTFPMMIKDTTKLASRAVNMEYADFIVLTTFLANIQKELWAVKAEKEATLLEEKAEILAKLG